MAVELLGRPLPNRVMLGGFAAISGLVSVESVAAAVRERFPGALGAANAAAVEAAHEYVLAEMHGLSRA